MGVFVDQIAGRRPCWNGVIVEDLRPDSPDYRGYFRVTWSERDRETGAWSIWWRRAEDRVDRPVEEPIYKFTGITWDLPAYAFTVIPWIHLACHAVGLSVGMVIGADVLDSPAGAFMAFVCWCVAGAPWLYAAWMITIEPVRGRRVLAGVIAWSAYRRYQNDQHSAGFRNELYWTSATLNYIREMPRDEARRYGFTSEHLR